MKNTATLSVHSGEYHDTHGAVMPPIYATSTFAQPAPGEHTGYEYSRSGNPTRHALETAIAELEGGTRGYAFASGLAAISTVLELLDKDSHIVAIDDVYGGTYRLIENVRKRSTGLQVSWVKPDDIAGLEAAIRPNTRMIWVETPTNPLLKLADPRPSQTLPGAIMRSAWRIIPSPPRSFTGRWRRGSTLWFTPPPNISTVIQTWLPGWLLSGQIRISRSVWAICKTRLAAFWIRSAAS